MRNWTRRAVWTISVFLGSSAFAAPAPIRVLRIASGLQSPVYATAPRDDPRLFVLERAGRVRILENGLLRATPFLDITSLVSPLSGEFGCLGLAFPPDYAASRVFFVFYSARHADPALQGSLTVARYRTSTDPNQADPSSGEMLFSLPKPPFSATLPTPRNNHNGGTVTFDSTGVLWLALGDGGGGDDPDQLAQSDVSFFGKLLRFDFGGDIALATPALSVHAKGLRNPFRFSVDRTTDDLWIGDVGQSQREEVDFLPAGTPPGSNFGWRCREGFLSYLTTPPCVGPLRDPVHDYSHSDGIAITGGTRYRGVIPELHGRYFFGDVRSRWWSFLPNGDTGISDLQDHGSVVPSAGAISAPVAFSEDGYGELVITDLDGEIFRVAPSASDVDADFVPDAVDTCPFSPDRGQHDRGGLGAGSAPDGIGDACQCGDVSGDGRVTGADAILMQRALAVPPTATLARAELADVGGSPGFSLGDAVIVRRAVLSPARAAIVPQCDPATP